MKKAQGSKEAGTRVGGGSPSASLAPTSSLPHSLPLSPIVLYARLAEASARLAREIQRLEEHANTLRLDAAWVHLDDLIEQLPDALVWDAQHQRQEEDTP